MNSSNYIIKKMLPRLIIAVILVNMSYYICAAAVDVSNVLGYNLAAIFGNFNIGGGVAANTNDTWVSIMSGLLAVAGAAALVVAIVLAPTVLLAFGLVILILVARKALVVLLIVLAPIAFVAFLLPNTEDWFKRWYKAFLAVLMVFPIVSIIFGASKLASDILMSIATASDDGLMKLVALGVMAVPLFSVPMVLKGSLAAAGSIGNRLQGMADNAQNRSMTQGKKKLDERYQNTAFARGRRMDKDAKQRYKDKRFAEAVTGHDSSRLGRARARMSRGITGRSWSNAGDYAQQRVAAAALSEHDKHYEEDVKAAGLQQASMTNAQVAMISSTGMINGKKATEYELAAALDRTMSSGSFDERRAALEYVASNKYHERDNPEGVSASLRNRAVQGAYQKGDQNIYGAGFGNEIVSDTGTINSAQTLKQATVTNAEGGKVSADHLVQSGAATNYLVNSVTDPVVGNAIARANVQAKANEVDTVESTRGRVTPDIAASLGRL